MSCYLWQTSPGPHVERLLPGHLPATRNNVSRNFMSKAQDHSPQNRRPGPEEHGSPIWKKRHAGAGNGNPVLQAPCFLFGRVLVRGRKEKTRKKGSGACGEGLKRETHVPWYVDPAGACQLVNLTITPCPLPLLVVIRGAAPASVVNGANLGSMTP
jgi:hypothetical protein